MNKVASNLDIPTPRWAQPLLDDADFKGAYGGRSGGKTHFFAELLIEEHILNPALASVCIREVQRSLRYSAKRTLETKIKKMGAEHMFHVGDTEIRDKRGPGIIIFQGMQDHTADSIKSLEGFQRAWVVEAQSLSRRSMDLLLPTIRADDSQLWFEWNPQDNTDPVEFMRKSPPESSIVVEANYLNNPFLPDRSRREAIAWQKRDPDGYAHVWMGEFAFVSDAQIFAGCYIVDEFTPGDDWQGPYQGLDFGFSQDPTAGVRCWIHDNKLFIEYEAVRTKLDLDKTAGFLEKHISGFADYVTRADSARPESISYLNHHGMPKVRSVKKGPGSVKDGIAFLKSFDEIIIHTRCKEMATEARLYSYKIDRQTGDPLPEIIDANNHMWDSIRYALQPLIKPVQRWGPA